MRNRTMDYERMYKKALERARAIYQGKYKKPYRVYFQSL